MKPYSICVFDFNRYSDEFIEVEPHEMEEVQRLIAEEQQALSEYADYLNQLEETERQAALEQLAFEHKQEQLGTVRINDVAIFINPDCSHPDCKSSQCSRDVRIGGIAI
jgi:hypothetical protein